MAYINKKKIYFAGISKGGGSCERYTDGIIVEDLSSSVIPEDELIGTWKFKDTVSLSPLTSATDFYVNFTYGDDIKGVAIKVNSGDYLEINYEYYDQENDEYASTTAYYGLNGWYGGQTINITSKLSEVSNGELLLEWLNANATKQEEMVATVSITLKADDGGGNTMCSTYVKFGEAPSSDFDSEYFCMGGSLDIKQGNESSYDSYVSLGTDSINIAVNPVAYIWVPQTDNLAGYKLNGGSLINVGTGYVNATEVQLSEGDVLTILSTWLD